MEKNKHYWLIGSVFLAGILLALSLYLLSYQWVKADRQINFHASAQHITSEIANELNDLANALYSVGDFVQYSPQLSQIQFQRFAQSQLLRNSSVLLFSWNPYILTQQRQAFEQQMQQDLGHQLQISQLAPSGQLVPDKVRGYYFPVQFLEPAQPFEYLYGLNFTDDEQLLAAIKKSLDTGQMVVTGKLSMMVDDQLFNGVVLLWPIYDVFSNDVPLNKKGVAIEVIDLDVFYKNLQQRAQQYDFNLYLSDVTSAATTQIYAFTDGATDVQLESTGVKAQDFVWQQSLSFADRTWRLVLAPSKNHRMLPLFGTPWFIFIACLLFTFAFCFYWLKRHHYTVERVLRADQHAVANKKLAKEIVERLRAEEKLIKFAHAFQLSADGINLLDMSGYYTYCNKASLSMYGYDESRMYNLHYHDINLEQEVEELDLLALVKNKGSWHGELRQSRSDGSKFSASVSLSLIKDDAGIDIGFLEVTRDNTETNLLEAELQQSRKMEALGTLAGGIAHDFNNILASILGNTEMMVMTKLEPVKGQKYLANIQESCDRAARLVKQIMTFSRMDTVQKELIDLAQVVREDVSVIRNSLPSNIHLISSITSEPLPIEGDIAQLHQVLLNLCTNAKHAIGQEGGTIAVDLKLDKALLIDGKAFSPHAIKLTVTDTGNGIKQENIDRIFDPFFTTKKIGQGTGLGLSVVKSAVEGHGGEISVKSATGQGTTFIITFPMYIKPVDAPIHNQAMVEANSEHSVMQNHQPDKVRNSTKHVLIVEDEPHISKLYQEFIKEHGYNTTVCEDGRQALDAFNNPDNHFDLVLTDQSMPFVTGKELSIVLLNKYPELPIIMCTGYSEVICEELAMKIGIKHYFLKPASMGKLMQAIDSLLKE